MNKNYIDANYKYVGSVDLYADPTSQDRILYFDEEMKNPIRTTELYNLCLQTRVFVREQNDSSKTHGLVTTFALNKNLCKVYVAGAEEEGTFSSVADDYTPEGD